MVRNYIKKNGLESKYSKEKLQRALDEIRAGTITIYKASVLYGISFATLYCRNKGTRGAIKKVKDVGLHFLRTSKVFWQILWKLWRNGVLVSVKKKFWG
ncbi:unnamed protein product [Parnassius mnemosyne]|uniref:HTH psq-type domain-containing protein n=1 Tax=Parnassius mnemosyne TaxID=213953 RepID=A0AAV1K695_9NEOP